MNKILDFIKRYNILIFITLGFLLYFPSLFYDFVFDDNSLLLSNQYINGTFPINFIDFFIPSFILKDIYTPFTFIIFWLIIKIFGINSFVFHFVNILFYVLSSIVFYYLLKRIMNNDLISFFATMFYIIHPCHIECTAWISAMGYNISALFFFLSFLYFILGFDDNKQCNYIYSVVFYILAILSQPISVTLPAILFLWVYCFRKERLRKSIIPIVSYIPFLFIYFFLYRQTVLQTDRFISVKYNILEKFSILGFDIFNSFIPINLCFIKPNPNLFFMIIPIFIIILLFKKDFLCIFFIGFEIISILPYSNLFFNIRIALADRYLFLSSSLFCVLIAYLSFYLLEKFKEKILLKYIGFIFFVALYLFSFMFYLPVWKNDEILWTYVYNLNSNNINVGRAYLDILMGNKKYDEALIVVDRVIENNCVSFDVYSKKMEILMNTNRIDDALKLSSKMQKMFPNEFKTYLYLFDVYMLLKDYDKAINVFNIAEEKCKQVDLYKNKNVYFFATKRIKLDFVLARPEDFIESLKIISSNFRLLEDNGEFSKILEKKDYKSREEICLHYLKQYNNSYTKFLIFLLSCLYMKKTYENDASEVMNLLLIDMDKAREFINKGDNNSAEKIYLSVISKNKYMYEAYYNLGILYLQTNRRDEAKKIFSKMLDISPNNEQIRNIYNSL